LSLRLAALNYRTSQQIGEGRRDVDGFEDDRHGTTSVFKGLDRSS
jgi:hypothetical protein